MRDVFYRKILSFEQHTRVFQTQACLIFFRRDAEFVFEINPEICVTDFQHPGDFGKSKAGISEVLFYYCRCTGGNIIIVVSPAAKALFFDCV